MAYRQEPVYDIPEENNDEEDGVEHHWHEARWGDAEWDDEEEEDPYEVVGYERTTMEPTAVIDGYVDYRYEMGTKGKAPGQFGGWVQHYTADNQGKILYSCDTFNKRIQLLDMPSGKYRHSFTTNIGGYTFQARGIAVLRNGSLCVNCVGFNGTSRIAIFSPEGQPIHYFGERSIGYSAAMSVDALDRITVVDRRKMRVITFDKEGEDLGSFDLPVKQDCLRVCTTSRGEVILPDHLENLIYVLSETGQLIRRMRPSIGTGISFLYPGSVSVDGSDNLFVCDVGHHRVMKFDSEGTFRQNVLTKREHHLWMPHDAVVTKHGHLLVTEVGSTFIKGFGFSSG